MSGSGVAWRGHPSPVAYSAQHLPEFICSKFMQISHSKIAFTLSGLLHCDLPNLTGIGYNCTDECKSTECLIKAPS